MGTATPALAGNGAEGETITESPGDIVVEVEVVVDVVEAMVDVEVEVEVVVVVVAGATVTRSVADVTE